MWVIVQQEDWVGGEDVLAVIGPFATEAQARADLALMQGEIDKRPCKDERLWLMRLQPAAG